MFRIIYISGETTRFTKDKLRELLEHCRINNRSTGITGLLLYKHGNFLQVIEGEEKPVRLLFEAIRQDPRHRRVIAVLEEQIHNRDFADWSMGFRNLDDELDEIPQGFNSLLHTPWDQLDLGTHSGTIQQFLRVFVSATN